MESVLIDIDPEKEAMVPRPDPNEAGLELCADILDRAETELFEEYRGESVPGIDAALTNVDPAADVTASPSAPPASADGGDEDTTDHTDAGERSDDAVDLDGSPLDESSFDAEPDVGSAPAADAPSGADGFDISFDDGPDDEPVDADLDWESSASDAETADAPFDDDAETEAETPDDPPADADDEPAADMDEWGFGDVTDADEGE
jgi:flagellar protein FlaI